ncbi:hypothetical protein P7C70_g1119, partial [Phenoliferia sp. Uapishka_3]
MSNCNSARTPIADGNQLEPGTEEEIEEGKNLPLGALVGSLLYAACWTRPDILAAVVRVASFVAHPTLKAFEADATATPRLKLKLHFPSYPVLHLPLILSPSAFTPVTLANCVLTTVATSTCHAEYHALSKTGGSTFHTRQLMNELGFPQIDPTILYGDNQGSLAVANSTGSHKRSKPIDIKYHYIRELIERGEIKVAYISTKDNIADIMTKGLRRGDHKKFVRALGLQPVARGGVLES